MNIEEAITKCEITLKQIKQYDPDPYYVNYFFNEYMISINNIIKGIFEEANRDFGLFVSGKISEQKFYEKAKMKNDENAIKFSEWYSKKYIEEHKNPYPDVISQVRNFKNKFKKLPEIKIMLRASERYKDDINQEIKVNLSNQKLRSRDELDIEIKMMNKYLVSDCVNLHASFACISNPYSPISFPLHVNNCLISRKNK